MGNRTISSSKPKLLDFEKWNLYSETVEKVPKWTLGGDAKKNDFPECATMKDLTMMKGRETPKNQALTIPKGFSTVSADMWRQGRDWEYSPILLFSRINGIGRQV
jgi:hypothetical protein